MASRISSGSTDSFILLYRPYPAKAKPRRYGMKFNP